MKSIWDRCWWFVLLCVHNCNWNRFKCDWFNRIILDGNCGRSFPAVWTAFTFVTAQCTQCFITAVVSDSCTCDTSYDTSAPSPICKCTGVNMAICLASQYWPSAIDSTQPEIKCIHFYSIELIYFYFIELNWIELNWIE